MAETNQTAEIDDHARTGAAALGQMKEQIALLRVIGRDMRAAQRRYFQTRKHEDLITAKTLERRFDELVR